MTTAQATIITKAVALDVLERAVAKRPEDYRYRYRDEFGEESICLYVVRDATGSLRCACIVGVALNELGVSPERIDEYLSSALPMLTGFSADDERDDLDDDSNERAYGDPLWFAHTPLMDLTDAELGLVGFEATDAATRVLWAAQFKQDRGFTWGAALAFARQVAAELVED